MLAAAGSFQIFARQVTPSFTARNVRRNAIVVRLAARPSIDDVWSIRASLGNRPAVARPTSELQLAPHRRHVTPLLLTSGIGGAVPLTPLSRQSGSDAVSEADIKTLVHAHPACLPIAEIDPMFSGQCRSAPNSKHPQGLSTFSWLR